tara:strand:- start:414 stop:1004 length:591 start_codon:yes stop_codon:yes gene_type:complete
MSRKQLEKILGVKAKVLVALVLGSTGVWAAGDAPLLSLDNTNFVVSLAFIAFVAILVYLKVPSKIGGYLDDRSSSIKEEIDNANSILEESKSLLAELEREHKNNIELAEKIISDAEAEAKKLVEDAKKEIRLSIERKVKIAEEQIQATESAVIKGIKDKAVEKSFELAELKISEMASNQTSNALIEKSTLALKGGV